MKRWWLALSLLFLFGRGHGQELERYEFSRRQMGTRFRIVLYAEDPGIAFRAAELSFARIEELNRCLSDYLPGSELNRLSFAAGSQQWISVSPDLCRVLNASLNLSEETNGAFDITVGPLSWLWREAFDRQEFPPVDLIAEAQKLVDYRKVEVRWPGCEVQLTVSDTRLDLGGIGKGYALDQALTVLKELGVRRALVDGGGDIVTGEAPPGERGWKILFHKNASQSEPVMDSIWLVNQAMATSGDHFRYLEWQGQRYSHIIDPRTGLGVTHQNLVTVVGPSGVMADGLASAFSVLDGQERESVLRKYPAYQIMIFEKGTVP